MEKSEERPPDARRSRLGILARALQLAANAGDSEWKEFCAQASQQGLAGGLTPFLRDLRRAASGVRPLAIERIGKYRIHGELGAGGMGRVYLGEGEAGLVAIKVVRAAPGFEELIERFRRECELLRSLKHPNVVRIYDAGEIEDGQPFLVMEFISGDGLLEFAERRGLPLEQRLRLFLELCAGVDHAHQRGVLHRDLKPDNVLIETYDEGPRVRLIDFGIAKPLDEGPEGTIGQRIFASPAYVAPERLDHRAPPVDTRVDVYSLGVLLFELIAGRLPAQLHGLTTLDANRLRHQLQRAQPERLSDVISNERAARLQIPRSTRLRLRDELDWVVLRASAADPEQRYASVGAMRADLQAFLEGRRVEARPWSRGYELRTTLRRYRKALTLATAVLLALGIGLGLFALEARVARARARDLAASLAEIGRLRDGHKVSDLERRARELWPSRPERLADLDAWTAEAEALLGRRERHRATLHKLRERLGDSTLPSSDRELLLWRKELLQDVLGKLKRLGERNGLLDWVRERRAFATRIESASLRHPAWPATLAEIADIGRSPRYGGLEIDAQMALVPLDRDPESRLFEFAELESGRIPERDANGRLVITPETGIVFVLLPGARYAMGAQREDPDATHYDPAAETDEAPVHDEDVEPFFLAKHEITRGQWQRMTRSSPSRFPIGRSVGGRRFDPRHPVESVAWIEAREILARFGLRLPTEVEWEYAARAGQSGPWAGAARSDLVRRENVADQALQSGGGSLHWHFESWNDTWSATAPVASFTANAFGLHDMLGNVCEWTASPAGTYGELQLIRRLRSWTMLQRVVRGGCWRTDADRARVSYRGFEAPRFRDDWIGLRAARMVDR